MSTQFMANIRPKPNYQHLKSGSNGYAAALAELKQWDFSNYPLADGEEVLARYEDSKANQKTLVGVANNNTIDIINNTSEHLLRGYTPNTGATPIFSATDSINEAFAKLEAAISNLPKKPVVLYETDGNTGLLGINNSTVGENWQLTGYDFSPYKYLKCYFKMSDYNRTSNYLTPSVVVILPLDAASRAQKDNTTISPSTPCDMYIGAAAGFNPNDRNVLYFVMVAVDTTKTKFQVVTQNSIYGTALGGRNDNGRYLYKIEGCFD